MRGRDEDSIKPSDAIHILLPDDAIHSALSHIGSLLAMSYVIGNAVTPEGREGRFFVNAARSVIDFERTSPTFDLIQEGYASLMDEGGIPPVRLHPQMAVFLEQMGVPTTIIGNDDDMSAAASLKNLVLGGTIDRTRGLAMAPVRYVASDDYDMSLGPVSETPQLLRHADKRLQHVAYLRPGLASLAFRKNPFLGELNKYMLEHDQTMLEKQGVVDEEWEGVWKNRLLKAAMLVIRAAGARTYEYTPETSARSDTPKGSRF